MNIEAYIEERIKEFEKQLAVIEDCKAKERSKPIEEERDWRLASTLSKHESMFNFCLSEFKSLKEKIK